MVERLRGLSLLGLQQRSIVCLVDLVGWEVGGIDVARQARLKWCPDSSKGVEFNASEERVALDFVRTATTQTIFGINDKAESVH